MADSTLYIPKLKQLEGGLSNAKTDNASRKPSPCTHAGMTGIHTNKGIRWTTFTANASKYGYAASCDNFIKMPYSIWQKIYKGEYWDTVGGDKINSQPIAELLADMAYHGYNVNDIKKYLNKKGLANATLQNRIDSINKLIKQNEQQTYVDLIELRRNYLVSLNQPSNMEGWMNRLEQISKRGFELLSQKAKAEFDFMLKNGLPAIASGLIIGLGIGLFYFTVKNKK
jgi:lysozyme family protein